MPFGLKPPMPRPDARARLRRLRSDGLALQFGGAAGTLAALGDNGLAVAERLAQELKLSLPDAPWHTHRDRIAEAASVFAILAGTCGKIARDVQLMMQTDVAEAFEPSGEGRGGSSTMPHTRNPVAAATALAAATMAPNLAATIFAAQVGDHERSAGPWHAEWPSLRCCSSSPGALAPSLTSPKGWKSTGANALNHATHGLIKEAVTMALAEKIGDEAHLWSRPPARGPWPRICDVLASDAKVKYSRQTTNCSSRWPIGRLAGAD